MGLRLGLNGTPAPAAEVDPFPERGL
ncbi:hypothetical protein BOS5A_10435 [Bosea sp. EC-HK365B]|nr:hypothetical protein BOSE7B_150500 [Bosea sp. 7B]VVT44328.1 hypothetical protein BOS5A_10435 [Bosea sp. EC-HK365B]VXC44724.1 hypothetical protein BOSE127_190127 [Bosea sp. 127]